MTKKSGFLSKNMKQWGIFLGWFLGPLLLGFLSWFFTQPLRNQAMIRSVNQILSEEGSPVRLEMAFSSWGMAGQAMQAGTWYSTVNSETRVLVFTIPQGGSAGSYLGIIAPNGTLESILPLCDNSARNLERLPQGIIDLYARRIEQGAASLRAEGGTDG